MIDHIFDHLRPFVRYVARRPLQVILAALVLAGIGLYFSLQLRIDSDFANLIPQDYPSVQALETLRQNVGGESEAAVAIESPSFEANRQFAEDFIPRALDLVGEGRSESYFTTVAYRREVSFLEQNALYFATPAELQRLEGYLSDQIRQARLEANPFYFELDEEEGSEAADTVEAELEQLYDDLVGQEYPVSEDSTILALRLYPSGAQTDLQFIEDAYEDLEQLVDEMDPSSYHPEMEVTLAGRLLRQLVEVRSITRDVTTSFGTGVFLLLLMVVIYFFYKSYEARVGRTFNLRVLLSELARTPATALVMAVPLAASLTWTFGITYAMYGTLNIMTSTLGLLLFGLGIDFGIHFYARYAEERGEGRTVAEAVERTFMSTGQAISVVAFTTAGAFYVLMLADFRGFSEFGFVAGTGILLALIAMTVLLPAVVALFERLRLLNLGGYRGEGGPRIAFGRGRFRGSRAILAVSLVAVGLAIFALPDVSFEYEFGALEPEYEEYNQLNRKIRQVYSDRRTRNAAYIVVDEIEEVPAVVEAIRQQAASDTVSPTIRAVESLQDRFPMTVVTQQSKLDQIADIRALLDDPFLRAADSDVLDRIRRAAATYEPVTIDQVPDFLKQPFTSRSGEIGGLVIIYPSVGLSHGLRSIEFAEDVGTVTTEAGQIYHAGSTSIVAADMLRLMLAEVPYMIGLTILLIFVFKWIMLRKLRWVLLAFLPLVASFLWMFGLMTVFGWKLNFYNLVVLPTVLGIGDDSGIHITHRYLEEGKGSIRRVLRSTGEHITMSSMTTILGFGGLLVSMHPGMRTIGELAMLGIGMTLLAALLFLPAALQWLEDRGWLGDVKNPHAESSAGDLP